jgi:hypothetical protein
MSLDELKRVVRLWLDIHPNHIEASLVVAHGCATSPAEQVEE